MDRARLFVFVLVAALLYLYARCASAIFPPAATIATRPRNCTSWTFERYEASSFEKLFLANADAWGQRPCDTLRTMQADADEWVALAAQSGRASLPSNTSTNVMSSFYFRTCEGESVRVMIEPIGGVMRHPHTCTNFGYLLDKDSWLVIHWTPPAVRPARFFLFDIGASTWHSGAGGASQVWFWQEYRRRGVDFDELYAWEATAHSPKEVWAAIPPEVRPRYHWFNVPAETSRTMDNPLELLRAVARPEDFVVMKVRAAPPPQPQRMRQLDIDTPAVEMPLVEQLLSDAGLAALVDEFFFEHHVNMEPLASCCWGTTAMKDTAAASYRLFGALRKLGIRAHSWV